MSGVRCVRCGKTWWTQTCGEHRCPPAWVVWMEDDEHRDGARTVRAIDEEEAAEEFIEAHENDGAEYPVGEGRSKAVVCVLPASDPGAKPTRIRVTGEPTITYYTERVEDAAEDSEGARAC